MAVRFGTIASAARARFPAAALAAALLLAAAPAHALRVVTWNLFNYPDYNLAGRQPNFRTVMANIGADVLIAQELNSAAGRDSFLNNVLNVVEPGQWAASSWIQLQPFPIEGGAIFYKPARVGLSLTGSFPTSGPRAVLATRVTPVGYVALAGTFNLYSMHLKAGNPSITPADSATRRAECKDIRDMLNLLASGTNFLLGGDTNFYGEWEGGYARLTESQADNDGRGKDPLTMPGTWHVVPGYSVYFTQCPCNTGCGSFSGGGMDDRFDLFLHSYSMANGQGVDFVPGGYFAYGNDGNHFNDDINGGGYNTAVGLTIATALKAASDHLPVVCTAQVASKIAAASQLDFGQAILGGSPQQTLSVSNPAVPPADGLDYSFVAPAGFTAPGGSFVALAGAAANDHTLGMSTATTGQKTGTLTVNTDAPDSLAKTVKLSGTVLRHSVASLDSQTVMTLDTLDLGAYPLGAFRDSLVRAHNQGYDALQARLAVTDGVITGGGGRFSIVGGFSPVTLAGVGGTWNIHFNDSGATIDSTYEATLTFTTSDEPLPGAASQSPLTVTLLARRALGPGGVGPGDLPTALRFYAPRPNPLSAGTAFVFDLPRDAHVSLEVFDLTGRRLTSLASGPIPAGRHEVRWNAAGDRGGRVPAGLYFARFSTPGLSRTARLVVLP